MMKPGTGLTILLLTALAEFNAAAERYKLCAGTSHGDQYPISVDNYYQNLRDRYIDCTHVDGNLEIKWIEDDDLDFSFLNDIREVTGYVLIYEFNIRRLVLPNLRIIRGRNLFINFGTKYALYVESNAMETLELPALREISSGGVIFEHNLNLCYMNTVNWEEIMDDKSSSIEYIENNDTCPPCHEACERGCWGPGPNNCQKFSNINCSSECHQRRCFGPNPLQCCHSFCTGGCFGPTQSHCFACKYFDDNGVCREQCPSMERYNWADNTWEINPDGKYAFGYRCVKSCPEHFLRDDGGCVRFCPEGKKDVEGECVSCDGPCPKTCKGVELVQSGNIHAFKGCTIIEGSVRIGAETFYGRSSAIHPDELEVFSTLKEVTGFVRIKWARYPDFKALSYFRNLEIVHGRELTDRNAALHITLTELQSLNLHSLRKVRAGNVVIAWNSDLCFAGEIEWQQLMTAKEGTVRVEENARRDECKRRGLVCHEQCSSDGCWGPRPDECLSCKSYKLKETCVSGCDATRGIYDAGSNMCEFCDEECLGGCFGPGPSNCTECRHATDGPYCVRECPISKYNENGECKPCHESCGNGCTGPLSTVGPGGCNSCDKAIVTAHDRNIATCKYFDDNGVCKQVCPPMTRFNPVTYSWEMNPDGRYSYGHICVKKCPEPFLRNSGACVRSCPETKKNVDGECIACDGPCPKTCKVMEIVHAGNIHTFKGCTVIEGFVKIVNYTFSGFIASDDADPVFPEMHPDELEVFSTLKEVTGFVHFSGYHPDFRNLSYFRNLEIVRGRQVTRWGSAILIYGTSLQSLNLRSLKEVRSGHVVIVWNPYLCFVEEIEWQQLMPSKRGNVSMGQNAYKIGCRSEGLVCHEQCSKDGCWGSGPDECLSCQSYKLKGTCVPSCNATRGFYDVGSFICEFCDEECLEKCLRPGPSNCTQCRHARDGPYCVRECPVGKYNENGECKLCHESCANGCTGPRNTVGPDGCNSSDEAIRSQYELNITVQCVQADDPCPIGYYEEYPSQEGIMKSLTRNAVCRKCHPRCKNCTAYDILTSVCDCLNATDGKKCLDDCPPNYYANASLYCLKCAQVCKGCHGPSSTECKDCRWYRVYLSADRTTFNCTSSCPADKPHEVDNDNMGGRYCSDVDPALVKSRINKNKILAIVGGVVGCIALIFCAFGYQRSRRVKNKERTTDMEMTETGGNERKNPSKVKPNMARLRIINEDELRLGGIAGSGAFGTVYNAVWVPKGENVKLPVAVKVLRNDSSSNKCIDILDEAHIMASVDHPNLLKLLAISMTARPKLVTALMPLGCLLHYVRSNKGKIGSKPLLSWCSQIARGMSYLEERRIIHRDLALRNILVQTPECIKITDFGLARFLRDSEEEYKYEGGKMPFKWLALECIQYGTYTHKSDVWAYGVTIWELLTYGSRPYEHIPTREIPYLLANGDRLPQPSICTNEVYACMCKCWSLEPESRPRFNDLVEQFSAMALHPDRFLVIQDDALLQLPDFSREDNTRLIRTIASSIEAPGEVMDAEDYCYPNTVDEEYDYPNTASEGYSYPRTEDYCYPNTVDEEYDYPNPSSEGYSYPRTEEHEYAEPDSAEGMTALAYDGGVMSRHSPVAGCSKWSW